MKKTILFLSVLVLILSCKNEKIKNDKTVSLPKTHEGLFVKGTINVPDNSIVFLQKRTINKAYETINSTKTKNKSFSFSEAINEEELYFLGFNNQKNKVPFIANNFETFIDIDINDIENAKVEGSTMQKEYSEYTSQLKNSKNKFVFKTNYIKKNKNSILSAIVLKEMLGKTKWRIDQNKKAYKILANEIQNTTVGKEINKFITKNEVLVAKDVAVAEVSLDPKISNEIPVEIIEKVTPVKTTPRRRKAPNFYAESITGNDISLNSILSKNKVVLIDFWASWCAPCRAESPHIKRLYNKYHAKGFDVIGVSEDKYVDSNKWKNAVATDGLPWNQVIDDNKRVANMFGVKAIPHTVLLDANGGIILNKKSSYTIEKKLKQIFGF